MGWTKRRIFPHEVLIVLLFCVCMALAGGVGGTLVVDACLRGNCEAFALPPTKNADADVQCACECRFKGRLLKVRGAEPSEIFEIARSLGLLSCGIGNIVRPTSANCYFRAVSGILYGPMNFPGYFCRYRHYCVQSFIGPSFVRKSLSLIYLFVPAT